MISSSNHNPLVPAEMKETQKEHTINVSLAQAITNLQTASLESLLNETIFTHNTPLANNLDFLKYEAEMTAIKSYETVSFLQ